MSEKILSDENQRYVLFPIEYHNLFSLYDKSWNQVN